MTAHSPWPCAVGPLTGTLTPHTHRRALPSRRPQSRTFAASRSVNCGRSVLLSALPPLEVGRSPPHSPHSPSQGTRPPTYLNSHSTGISFPRDAAHRRYTYLPAEPNAIQTRELRVRAGLALRYLQVNAIISATQRNSLVALRTQLRNRALHFEPHPATQNRQNFPGSLRSP
jgi:hypothetical protein